MEHALDAIMRHVIDFESLHALAVYAILLAVLAKNQYK